jgi:hypothetical protein
MRGLLPTGHAAAMKNTATFRRTAAAAGLVTTVLLMIVSTVLAPEFPAGSAAQLAAIDEGGFRAAVSAFGFTLAQLPFIVGVLGIGHLLRDRAPRLSNVGTGLAVVGGFGHAVYGGVTMLQLEMAADVANRAVHARMLEQLESGPAVAFMAMGLFGTVLGVLLLSIGLFRAGVGPRWVGPALWAFLVVEFAGHAVSDWGSHLAVILYTAAFGAIAVTIWQSSEQSWARAGVASDGDETALRRTVV